MTRQEALNILKPEGNQLDALKVAYRAKAKQWHPDMNPGNEAEATEVMKTVNAAYDLLQDCISDWFNFPNAEYDSSPSLDEQLFELLKKIRHLPRLNFEVCGSWLWVTGETKEAKDTLAEHGLKFAPQKKSWYWRPAGYRRKGGKPWDMNAIRSRYGSQDIQGEEREAVN